MLLTYLVRGGEQPKRRADRRALQRPSIAALADGDMPVDRPSVSRPPAWGFYCLNRRSIY